MRWRRWPDPWTVSRPWPTAPPSPFVSTCESTHGFPSPTELAAYYAVCEALTNAVKHTGASVIDVQAETSVDVLRVSVHDDGCGAGDLTRGSGLVGLTDRVEALGGRFSLHSPPGGGTTLQIVLPLTAPSGRPENFPTR